MENIDFCSIQDAIHVDKESGTSVDYFLFDEYEIHINSIAPHTIQEWHFHSKIEETLLVTKGTLLCRYMENEKEQQKSLAKNDLVCVKNTVHTFENNTDEAVEFVVFRFVPDGVNKREIIKNDKQVVEREDL